VSIAPLQGQAGASLVAHVMLSEYDDHLPLYRQQQQFLRLGVNFARETLCDWVEKWAEWLQAIAREMNSELLALTWFSVQA
jgi:transposase